MDYIEPIMDVTQQGGKNIGILTYVDESQGIVGFASGKDLLPISEQQKAIPDNLPIAIDFRNYPIVGSMRFNKASTKIFPGLVNPARLALSFGYTYKALSITPVLSSPAAADAHVYLDNVECASYPVDELPAQYQVLPQDTPNTCPFKRS